MCLLRVGNLEYVTWIEDEQIPSNILEEYFSVTKFTELEKYGIVIKMWNVKNTKPVYNIKEIYLFAWEIGDLSEFGIIGVDIGNISYTDRDHRLNDGKIYLKIFDYGRGYTGQFLMKLKNFIEIPFNDHSDLNKHFIEKFYGNTYCFGELLNSKYFKGGISDSDKIKILQNILKYKIKLKKKKL